ncbi:hypothetical protein DD929_13875, partial [Staphylococcus pseudintermedius]|uniref:hypothetical protein n=1 Tax=Staphylococcus pseudintermedius TaxID=283734 RepID=UPI000D96B7C0
SFNVVQRLSPSSPQSTFLIVNTVLKIIFDIRQQQQNVNFLSKIDVAYEVIKLKLISILKNPFSMLHFEHFGYTLIIMLPLFLFFQCRPATVSFLSPINISIFSVHFIELIADKQK